MGTSSYQEQLQSIPANYLSEKPIVCYTCWIARTVNSVGRVSALHAEGRGFESLTVHKSRIDVQPD